jgi:3-dehydroquinate dehydratase-2
MKILVIHGPNLNMLGSREAGIYGHQTLSDVNIQVLDLARSLEMDAEVFQSNSEGAIVDAIQAKEYDVLIINPAAYTHTSVAIRDAIAAVGNLP